LQPILNQPLKSSISESSTANPIRIRPGRGVLVVDSQGLGDVVQSLPLLKAVCSWAHGRWPVRALFASPGHYELVQEENLEMIPLFVPQTRNRPARLLHLWRQLARQSDLIINAPEISPAKLALLKFVTSARYAVGEASVPFSRFLTFSVERSWTRPYLDTQDKIALALGIRTPLEPPSIRINPGETAWAKSELAGSGFSGGDPILGIQCSSVVQSKRWPAENFGEFVWKVHRSFPGLRVISFGTSDERRSADIAHQSASHVRWFEATGKCTIRQTLAMLNECELFVSGDTGLMHMAAALGVRTLSIFGPTSVTRRAPLHNGGIALSPNTPCHPCYRGRWTPCTCIRQISVEEVLCTAEKCFAPKLSEASYAQ
jgi:ADP-heptose:LPS heptosyltransferase